MRYIGGKSLLLDDIGEIVSEKGDSITSVLDIFSGTGVVASYFKENGYKVYSNDFLYFSYVLQKCHIELLSMPDFRNLGFDPVRALNDIDTNNIEFTLDECFVYQNYSLGGSDRMYFQEANALKIDAIRLTIEKWYNEGCINDDEYYYLICSLIEAVPYVANITGVYAAYLKFWDKRTYNPIILEHPQIGVGKCAGEAHNEDYATAKDIECDLLYADPPYNSREYLPNYHVLETIARYDYPVLHGVTGMRDYDQQKSDFSKKSKVKEAFENLISKCKSRYVLISYNNEGLLPSDELIDLCEKYAKKGTFKLKEMEYRRYKNKIPNNTKGLKEQLYFLERN